MLRRAILSALVFVAACSSEGPALDDAGAGDPDATTSSPDASSAEPIAPARPNPITQPSFTPCPPGWREVVDDELTICDPWPETGHRTDCPEGQAHFPGNADCTPIGAPCPAGDFSDDLPMTGVVYARAGATNGDGSITAPFGTLAAALAAVPRGGIIALAKGSSFNELVRFTTSATITGACAAETAIDPNTTGMAATLEATGGGTHVVARNLRIGGRRPGVASVNGAVLELDGVLIRGVLEIGVVVTENARAKIEDVVVEDIRGDYGRGLNVNPGGSIEVKRAIVDRPYGTGVLIFGTATVEDLYVREGRGLTTLRGEGQGIVVQDGASATMTRTIVERAMHAGIFVSAATLTISDSLVSDTQNDNTSGFGVQIEAGSTFDATRLRVARNLSCGIVAIDDSVLWIADSYVHDTGPQPRDGRHGEGLGLQRGAQAEVKWSRFARNTNAGIDVGDPGTTLSLIDVDARDTNHEAGDSFGIGGIGIQAYANAMVTIRGAQLDRNHWYGLLALGGSAIDFEDVVVRDMQEFMGQSWGGFGVGEGASAVGARLSIERSSTQALEAFGRGSTVRIEDVTIEGTRSRGLDGNWGRGVQAEDGANVELTRARIHDNQGVGVCAYGEGTTVKLTEASIQITKKRGCDATASCSFETITGIGSFYGASIEANRFVIHASEVCGVQVAGGTLDLHDGQITSCQIGANVQTEGYDLSRLQDRVAFRDNEVNLDSMMLAIPAPAPSF